MLCVLREDWYALSLILVGILVNGVSCLVLGSAELVFTHPEPVKGSPATRGDGIITLDKDMILLKGTESAVSAITRGKFSLRFSSKGHYNLVWCCSLLFIIQCTTQFLPQASLFGQIMFLISLGISALCNASLSSLDKGEIHHRLFVEKVLQNPTFSKYTLGTRTAAVVFMLLILKIQAPPRLFDELLPENTKAWKQWKATILQQLHRREDQSLWQLGRGVGDLEEFMQEEKDLLEMLYDARAAYNGYSDYLRVESL